MRTALNGLLMKELGFRGIFDRLRFLPSQLAFTAFGFMVFRGLKDVKGHQNS